MGLGLLECSLLKRLTWEQADDRPGEARRGLAGSGQARQGEARIRGGRWETAVAAVVCVMLLVGLLIAMHCSPWTQTALSKLPTVKDVGNYLLGQFLFMFELASVLLLVVMIAAAYLARPRSTKQRAQKIRKAGNKSV